MSNSSAGNFFLLSTFEQETQPQKSVLYRAAYSLLGNQSEAEDAVQETYLQAWKSFDAFQPGTNCRAWMFSILFNVVHHQRRKWIFRFRFVNELKLLERSVPPTFAREQRLNDPEILAALRKLPQSYAEALLLAYVEELSYKEVSEFMGCPIGTVMSRISRGREQLRLTLAPVAKERGILRTRATVS